MKKMALMFLLFAAAGLGVVVTSIVHIAKATDVTATTCPAEPTDAWVLRRLGYCNTACGGYAPFIADVARDGDKETARCECQRPAERIRYAPTPKPPEPKP